jgi:hypothetical protein
MNPSRPNMGKGVVSGRIGFATNTIKRADAIFLFFS